MLTCAVYLALQWPGFSFDEGGTLWRPSVLYATWCASLLACSLAWHRPVFLIVPAVWLPWIKSRSSHLTGFDYTRMLDIQPVVQLLLAVSLAYVALQVAERLDSLTQSRSATTKHARRSDRVRTHKRAPGALSCSGVAKVRLDDGPLSWALVVGA